MVDTEKDYNGDNPNGWGWSDRHADTYYYRRDGDVIVTIAKVDDKWNGVFFGVFRFQHEDMSQVFRVMLTKLVEYGY